MNRPKKPKKNAHSSHYTAPAMGMSLQPCMVQTFTLSCCLDEARHLRAMATRWLRLQAEAIAEGRDLDFVKSFDCYLKQARVALLHYQEKKRLRELTRQHRDLKAGERADSKVEAMQASIEQCQQSLQSLKEELRVAELECDAQAARGRLLREEARQRAKADAASAENSTRCGDGSSWSSAVNEADGQQVDAKSKEAVVA